MTTMLFSSPRGVSHRCAVGDRRVRRNRRPEWLRALALAMLDDAAQTLGPGVGQLSQSHRRQYRRATVIWLRQGNVGGLTFDDCCEILRVDPRRMRPLMWASAIARWEGALGKHSGWVTDDGVPDGNLGRYPYRRATGRLRLAG